MGLFDFVKDAGEKMFGAEEKKEDIVSVSPERINQLRQEHITKMIQDAGLQIENLKVVADGELVTLDGTATNQQDSEKAEAEDVRHRSRRGREGLQGTPAR